VTPTCVLVLGDTHLRDGARLPAQVFELAERADAILHTGDIVEEDVLAVLRAFAPVTVVLGNNDYAFIGRLPERVTVTLGGVEFGMVHDAGATAGRFARLRSWFPTANVALYGHSHDPECSLAGDLLVVNPGSPTQRRRAPQHTVAWLEATDGVITEAHLVEITG